MAHLDVSCCHEDASHLPAAKGTLRLWYLRLQMLGHLTRVKMEGVRVRDVPKRIFLSALIKLYSVLCPLGMEPRDVVLVELLFFLLA